MKSAEKFTKILGQVLFISIIVTVSSCAKSKMERKDKVAAIIGTLSDPFVGATFTPQVLIDKSEISNGALPFTYEAFATFFMSEKKTGIDNNGQVQIVGENSGGMIPNGYVFIPLSSAEVFKTLVEKELGAKVQEKNGAYYFRKDEDNYVVAWKDDLAIMGNIPFSLDNLFSKGTNESKKAAIRLVGLLNEASKKNINKEFRSFFDKEGDMRIYANGQSAYNLIDGMRFVSKKDKNELKSLLVGTTFESALNFENGSIEFDGNYALADSLKSYFDILKSDAVDQAMLNYGLTNDPVMAIAANFSMVDLVRVLNRQRDLLEIRDLDKDLAEMNLKLNDLPKLFTGEMMVVIDAVEVKEREYTAQDGSVEKYSVDEPIMLSISGLNDPKRMSELITKLSPEGTAANRYDDSFYLIKDNKLFLTNSELWFEAIKNGKTVKINDPGQNLSSSAVGMHMSANIAKKFVGDMDDIDALQKDLSDFVVKVSNTGTKMSIKFKDENKNALRLILERMVEQYENQEKSGNSDIEDILNDELIESITKEIEAGVEEVINSDELKEVLNSF